MVEWRGDSKCVQAPFASWLVTVQKNTSIMRNIYAYLPTLLPPPIVGSQKTGMDWGLLDGRAGRHSVRIAVVRNICVLLKICYVWFLLGVEQSSGGHG